MPAPVQAPPVAAVCGGSVAVPRSCGRWLAVWQPRSVKLNWFRSTLPPAGSAAEGLGTSVSTAATARRV